MKNVKKINNAKLKNDKSEKARTVAANAGKKAVSGCPELNFHNDK